MIKTIFESLHFSLTVRLVASFFMFRLDFGRCLAFCFFFNYLFVTFIASALIMFEMSSSSDRSQCCIFFHRFQMIFFSSGKFSDCFLAIFFDNLCLLELLFCTIFYNLLHNSKRKKNFKPNQNVIHYLL